MFDQVYEGRRCLVTGHNGFKGSWLSLWLSELGAEVHGLSLAPEGGPSLYETLPKGTFESETVCDIRDFTELRKAIDEIRPEIVLHLAAQPIVRLSYADPLGTLGSNVLGTAHVLEAIRDLNLNCTTLVITSDKCYENKEWEFAYRENDPMGGHDVYSMSKGCAELVTQSWVRSFFLPNPALGPVATARAGNVIGGGDYAADRIVPDAVRAVTAGQAVLVRNPDAVRPWQHVLECVGGYLALAAKLHQEGKESRFASSFNFGPDPAARQPVRNLITEFLETLGGEWTDGSSGKGPHEAKLLSLAIDKASSLLGWKPVWSFEQGVGATAEWYHFRHVQGADHHEMAEFTLSQIRRYQNDAAQRGTLWAAGFSDLDRANRTTRDLTVPV